MSHGSWLPSPFNDDDEGEDEEHYVVPEIVPEPVAPKSRAAPVLTSAAAGFLFFGPVGALIGAIGGHLWSKKR